MQRYHSRLALRAPPLDTPDAPVAELHVTDDLRDRPDLNCEPLQAPGTARNLQLDET